MRVAPAGIGDHEHARAREAVGLLATSHAARRAAGGAAAFHGRPRGPPGWARRPRSGPLPPLERGVGGEPHEHHCLGAVAPDLFGQHLAPTVEIVEGYRTADGGSVRVLGTNPGTGGPNLKARVGLMLQGGGGIYPQARPDEILRLYASFHAGGRGPQKLIDLVGLRTSARTPYRRLSGGEKQRLALAVALVGDPEVLILDEPTAGMDPEGRAATRTLIAELRGTGVAILLTTHDLADVERLADHVALIDHGRLVAAGSPDELASSASPRLRFRLPHPLEVADREELSGTLLDGAPGSLTDEGGGRYRLDGVTAEPDVLARLARWSAERGLLIAELTTGRGSLEERYLELVAGAEGEPGAPRGEADA